MSDDPPSSPLAPIGGGFPAPPPLSNDPSAAETQYATWAPSSFRPPPGYVAYDGAGHADDRTAAGLGMATIALFWSVTAMSGLLAFALFARKSKWDDAVQRKGSVSDLESADNLVRLAAGLQLAVEAASVILVALWARRVATKARSHGGWSVRPGLATGGWFIPIGSFWVGFNQLRKADAALGGRSKYLGRWQAAFVFVGVFGLIGRGINDSDDLGASAADVSNTFQRQGVIGLIGALASALASFFAMKAIKEIGIARS